MSRSHTQKFRTKAAGFETSSGKRRIPLTLQPKMLDKINAIAESIDVSISSAIANILEQQLSIDRTTELALTDEEVELILCHRRIFQKT